MNSCNVCISARVWNRTPTTSNVDEIVVSIKEGAIGAMMVFCNLFISLQGLEKDTYYFKVDEDVVYIGEGAIKAMVEEALRNRFLFLSANVINHALLSHVHSRLGALQVRHLPYFS
jgi:hypothetical protein